MGAPSWRHAALGDFLRTRREELAPEAVGLPRGPRRRTPGLRREDVAAAAHVSATWYARLEQGRAADARTSPNPGVENDPPTAYAFRTESD